MTPQTAKQIVKAGSVLCLIHGAALILLMAYILFILTDGLLPAIMMSHVPLAAAIYLLWLGYRGLFSLTPGIVKQICNVMPFFLLVPFQFIGESSIAIAIIMAIFLLFFVFSFFGDKLLCRRLFPATEVN